jgi:hypothetical protein
MELTIGNFVKLLGSSIIVKLQYVICGYDTFSFRKGKGLESGSAGTIIVGYI